MSVAVEGEEVVEEEVAEVVVVEEEEVEEEEVAVEVEEEAVAEVVVAVFRDNQKSYNKEGKKEKIYTHQETFGRV